MKEPYNTPSGLSVFEPYRLYLFPAAEEGQDTSTDIIHRQPAYRGAHKSLARPTSRCILFDGENISFDVSLVIYIPQIMIIKGYVKLKTSVAVACFLPGRAKDLSEPLYSRLHEIHFPSVENKVHI
jgi:hypothetical protein